jgi:transcriptional regulator with XRE-family HTH domain
VSLERAFGEALREARHQRGLTQEELALDSGYSPYYVRLLEGGRKSPTLKAIARLADVLQLPASELVRRAEQKDSAGK